MTGRRRRILTVAALSMALLFMIAVALFVRSTIPSQRAVEAQRRLNAAIDWNHQRAALLRGGTPSPPGTRSHSGNNAVSSWEDVELLDDTFLGERSLWDYSHGGAWYAGVSTEPYDAALEPDAWAGMVNIDELRDQFQRAARSSADSIHLHDRRIHADWTPDGEFLRQIHHHIDAAEVECRRLAGDPIDADLKDRQWVWVREWFRAMAILRAAHEGDIQRANALVECMARSCLEDWLRVDRIDRIHFLRGTLLALIRLEALELETARVLEELLERALIPAHEENDHYLAALSVSHAEWVERLERGDVIDSPWKNFLDGIPARTINLVLQPSLRTKLLEFVAAAAEQDPGRMETTAAAFHRFSMAANAREIPVEFLEAGIRRSYIRDERVAPLLPHHPTGSRVRNAPIHDLRVILAGWMHRREEGRWPVTVDELVEGGRLPAGFPAQAGANWLFLELEPFLIESDEVGTTVPGGLVVCLIQPPSIIGRREDGSGISLFHALMEPELFDEVDGTGLRGLIVWGYRDPWLDHWEWLYRQLLERPRD